MIESLILTPLVALLAIYFIVLFRDDARKEKKSPLDVALETSTGQKAPMFKFGQWVRDHRNGKLGMVRDFAFYLIDHYNGETFDVEFGDGVKKADALYLHPALPRSGEYWMPVSCAKHDVFNQSETADGFWKETWKVFPHYSERIACGCYLPLNFGKGKPS